MLRSFVNIFPLYDIQIILNEYSNNVFSSM